MITGFFNTIQFISVSAAGMKQTAKMLDDAKHGLFSYYLMKGMEGDADSNEDKKITSGELHTYILANVSRMQGNQTPELQGDQSRVLVHWWGGFVYVNLAIQHWLI